MKRSVGKTIGWVAGCLAAALLGISGCTAPPATGSNDAAAPQAAGVSTGPGASEPAPRKPEPYVTPGLITQVDLQRVLELQDAGKLLLVDVRPSLFYAMGHLPEAISLPKKKFESEFPGKKEALDTAVGARQVIVLYCANVDCPDAYAVAKLLSAKGYAVSVYKGGWDEWKMTGF